MVSAMKKDLYIIFAVLVGLFYMQAQAFAAFETKAKAAIVVDFETGAVLLEKNADERMPTASMSKVMTMYMVFDALKAGTLSLEDELPVSEKAWRKGGSKMFVEVGKKVGVEDLIHGVIVQSGNDATIVLAEGLAGSEETFADRMTDTARSIGMKNSNFTNASGWPDPDHYSTARDLATLGRSLIANFPQYYGYYSEKDFTFNAIKQGNRNPLLYRNLGADGIKTGHTSEAGYGLIGSGERDGRRVVFVVSGLESSADRAQESAKILDWALRAFENEKVYAQGETVAQIPVVLGSQGSVSAVLAEDLVLTLPDVGRDQVKIKAVYDEPLRAPLGAGDQIGELQISVPGLDDRSVPLIAGHDVSAQDFFNAGLSKLIMILTGQASF